MLCVMFFFSSRRRHTRFDCDWSSDVCSSDLSSWRVWGERWLRGTDQRRLHLRARLLDKNPFQWLAQRERRPVMIAWLSLIGRSEERRVGEECRSRWSAYHLKKKKYV